MPLTAKEIVKRFRVKPGQKVRLKDFDPNWAGDESVPIDQRKKQAKNILSEDVESLSMAQELLFAADSWSVLIILQAMDAAGKDGAIKHVMSGVNPAGCQVFSFKKPSAEELDHNYLWRYMRALPERGRIGIFNRSYYEEVLVVRVHPELVAAQKLPEGLDKIDDKFWARRYKDINAFERHLARNGTLVLKFFLHLSKKEQKKRFLARMDDHEKHWKCSPADFAERPFWDDYMLAFEQALSATSTKWAPWYVIPADNKWVSRAAVANIVASSIRKLNLSYPKVTEKQEAALVEVRRKLEAE